MNVGVNRVVKAILDDDLLSADPAAWVTLYPERYPTTADVPIWFYKSLRDIMLPGGTDQDYQDRIVPAYGEDLTMEDTGVAIANRIAESAMYAEEEDDTPGWCTTVLQIKVHIRQSVTKDVNLVENAHLRIKQLLDCLTRQEMGLDGVIPSNYVAADKSIDPILSDDNRGMYFRWWQHRDLNNALQQTAIYRAHYRVLHLRGS